MRLFISYNPEGTITSAIKVSVMSEGLEHPFGQLEEDESVLELEPTAEIEGLESHNIIEQYKVDLNTQKLKPIQ